MRAAAIPGLDPSEYRPHSLHTDADAWPETNCYVDLWIGVLNALRLDPVAMLPFCFQADFEGDQWTFLKPSLDDLWTLYGIEVQELNVWGALSAHVREHLSQGHLPLVEVDAYDLPDASGTAYHSEHSKTTIAVNVLDLDAGHLSYFHNGGYHALGGVDLHAVLGEGDRGGGALPPYAEIAKLGRRRRLPPEALFQASLDLARRHLDRRPTCNPFRRFRAHLAAEAGDTSSATLGRYHRYAFATVRQCGAAFQMAAAYVRWLEAQRPRGLGAAAAAFVGISDAAKALLFKMARAANSGRPLQYESLLDQMESDWQTAFDVLTVRLLRP